MVKARCQWFIGSVVAVFLYGATGTGSTATLVVNTVLDVDPPGTCDSTSGGCSLREAVIESNNSLGMDVIEIPDGFFALTIVGSGEDGSATGDLDFTDDVQIRGAGSTATVLVGDGSDRVLHVHAGVTVHAEHLTITGGNSGAENGGGIHNTGWLALESCGVENNVTDIDFGSGGGIFNGGYLEARRCEISGNEAATGGGVVSSFGTLNLIETTVTGNVAHLVSGGGIFKNGGYMTMTACTISANQAAETGGGIYTNGSDAVLNNCTVSGNTVEVSYGRAGGIVSWGDLVLTNTTVSGNLSHGEDPGSIYHGGNILVFENTIVDGDCLIDAGVVLSSGGNLESPGNSCGLTDLTDQINIADPLLGHLLDNGGPTTTHELLGGSPAIDGGVSNPCPDNDQRGYDRWDPTCDTGSFEVGAIGPEIFSDGFESGDTGAWLTV